MRNLFHHAPEALRVGPHHGAVHGLQPQGTHNNLVFHRTANGAANQLYSYFTFSHKQKLRFCGGGWWEAGNYFFPPVRYITLSSASPRISATWALSRSCSSALMVAFTTLCGLCEPIDFVSTFGIPTA